MILIRDQTTTKDGYASKSISNARVFMLIALALPFAASAQPMTKSQRDARKRNEPVSSERADLERAALETFKHQSDLMRLAAQDEEESQPADAVFHYEAALALGRTTRQARRAETRLNWLRERSEGNYVPLAKLMTMQRIREPLTRERLVNFEREVQTFPEGIVRREARALIATAWLERLADPVEAERAHKKWLEEPNLEAVQRRLAMAGYARALSMQGKSREAITQLEQAGYGGLPEVSALREQIQDSYARWIFLGLASLFCLLGFVWGDYRRIRWLHVAKFLSWPRALAIVAFFLAPLFLAWLYDPVTLDSFAKITAGALAAISICIIVGAALDARSAGRLQRLTLAALAVSSMAVFGWLARGIG